MKKESAVVGIDIGYGFCKVVSMNQRVIIPSLVGPAFECSFKVGSGAAETPGDSVEIAGESFFVGRKAELCDHTFCLRTRDWVQSNIYAALLTSCLIRATETMHDSPEVSVVTGLPVDYFSDRAKAEAQVRTAAATLGINLLGIKVMPQPFGSVFDYCLDDAGEPSITKKYRLLGVVDIGQHTTDYAVVKDLINNMERSAGSITIGVHNIIDAVRRDLMRQYGRDNITAAEVQDCVRRTNSIRITGEIKDASDIVNAHIRNAAKAIVGEIKSRWATEGELDMVLLTGGGSVLLKSHLKDLSYSVQLMEGAQIANARGYFKHGIFLQKAAGAA